MQLNLSNLNKRSIHRTINNIGFVVVFFAHAALLIGCGYKEQELKPVEFTTIEYIVPPKEFLDEIIIPEPITPAKYLSLNIKDREKELTIYSLKLLSLLKQENLKKEELLKYIEGIKKAGENKQ